MPIFYLLYHPKSQVASYFAVVDSLFFSYWMWYTEAVLDGRYVFGYDETKGGRAVSDKEYMQEALALARQAGQDGEVPVGCVIVRGDKIVGRGRNRREKDKTALGHAELEAIADACKNLGGWRLWDCTLYVTLEPCPMCAGAIINARIPRVVFGATDKKYGACGSVCNLFEMDFNHHPQAEKGLLEQECLALMEEFFKELRLQLRERPKWKKPGNCEMAE